MTILVRLLPYIPSFETTALCPQALSCPCSNSRLANARADCMCFLGVIGNGLFYFFE